MGAVEGRVGARAARSRFVQFMSEDDDALNPDARPGEVRQSTLSAEELEKAPADVLRQQLLRERAVHVMRDPASNMMRTCTASSRRTHVSPTIPRNTLRAPTATNRLSQDETIKDLEVERAAHDETAEKMVQLQQRLEVTLQELANLERYTKRQQSVASTPGATSTEERLLKEEAYLKSRLTFVQQVRETSAASRARVRNGPRLTASAATCLAGAIERAWDQPAKPGLCLRGR